MNLIKKIESSDILTCDMWTYLMFVILFPFTIPQFDDISKNGYSVYTLLFTYACAFIILILMIKLKIVKIKYLRYMCFNMKKLDNGPACYKNAYIAVGIMSMIALIALAIIPSLTQMIGYVMITGMLCMRLENE